MTTHDDSPEARARAGLSKRGVAAEPTPLHPLRTPAEIEAAAAEEFSERRAAGEIDASGKPIAKTAQAKSGKPAAKPATRKPAAGKPARTRRPAEPALALPDLDGYEMKTAAHLPKGLAPDDLYPWPLSPAFVVSEDVSVDWLLAPDLDELATDLIFRDKRTAPFLKDADDVRIRFLWKRKGGASGEMLTLGRTTKASGMLAFFTGLDFVIWLAADHAWSHQMTREQVEAALFHELLHISYRESEDGDRTPSTRGHDAEVFGPELRVFGLWKENLRQTFGQLTFQLTEAAE